MTRSTSTYAAPRVNWIFLFWAMLCSVLFAAQASALTLSPTRVTVPVGGSAIVKISRARGEIQAESKNTAIATVSLSNVTSSSATLTVRGIGPGTATVYVRDSRSGNISLPVTVTPSMTVSPASLSLSAGSTGSLTASNASGTVSASSSNGAVA